MAADAPLTAADALQQVPDGSVASQPPTGEWTTVRVPRPLYAQLRLSEDVQRSPRGAVAMLMCSRFNQSCASVLCTRCLTEGCRAYVPVLISDKQRFMACPHLR